MGIVINLVASIIFVALGAGSYRYLYLPYKRRTNALSQLSQLDFSADPAYLCYGLIAPVEPSKQYTIAQGYLSAIILGYRVLADNYGRERVRVQNLSPENIECRGRLPFERNQVEVRVERSLLADEFSAPHV